MKFLLRILRHPKILTRVGRCKCFGVLASDSRVLICACGHVAAYGGVKDPVAY